MCGITGAVWSRPELAVDQTLLTRMTEVLRHRGPDDHGIFRTDCHVLASGERGAGVGLGFRRLAILDLESARQPMANEDETIWMVFNGEIYNYEALRQRLEAAGHTFRTQGDGEVIVHLYEDLGPDCLEHLNGMFAIAIWDQPRQQLLLARDRLGQKPLVYTASKDRLLFASELKSLLQVPDARRAVDATALDHYLTYQYVPHPWTILRGIHKLPPGHMATYSRGQLDVRPYWQPDFNQLWTGTSSQAAARLHELLESSVQLRLQSDVPLGAFLSGGVDSSLIVALMQKLTDRPTRTFSIGFPVREYDETDYARRVADHLGTEHHQFQVTPDAVEMLPQLVWHYDEPFADSSAIPTWYVSQLTRQHVTVALTGDGGDELFAGYPRYRAIALAQQLDRVRPLRRLLAARLWQRLPSSARQKSRIRQFKRFSQALNESPGRRYLDWISIFGVARRAALYTDEYLDGLANIDPYDYLGAAMGHARQRDPISQVALADLVTYLPGDLMTKVDIASMAHGLECRQPFLDVRVVEFAASLPIDWKFRNGRGKRILHDTFAALIPDFVWQRRKMGFGVPLDHWFRNELKTMTHDLLLDTTARQRGFFRPEYVEQLVDEHEQRIFDHAYRLWALLVFECWMRHWCDQTNP